MKIINLSEQNSVLNQYIKEIRSVEIQKDSMRFRRNLERIAEIMSYEISKTLNYISEDVQTPLGIASANVISERIVLATILRAGLPFHQGFLNYFDGAENAFVSAFRKYEDENNFEIHAEYIASPNLTGKTLLVSDPMLATGSSMQLSYEVLLTKGTPNHTHIAVAVASQTAVDYISQHMPENCTLWVATIDPDINKHSYIVPGLGDAGDLAYGEKL